MQFYTYFSPSVIKRQVPLSDKSTVFLNEMPIPKWKISDKSEQIGKRTRGTRIKD